MKAITAFNIMKAHPYFKDWNRPEGLRRFKKLRRDLEEIHKRKFSYEDFLKWLFVSPWWQSVQDSKETDPHVEIFLRGKKRQCTCKWKGMQWTRNRECPLHGDGIATLETRMYLARWDYNENPLPLDLSED